jgi:hypothetical protein
VPNREELTSSDERRAALTAAAGALRAWVKAQRAGGQVPPDPAERPPSSGPAAAPLRVSKPAPAPQGRTFQSSTSILALDTAEPTASDVQGEEAPPTTWVARVGSAYVVLKRWLAPLKGPAIAAAPYAARALVVLAIVAALAAAGGWAWRTYSPSLTEAWATFVAPSGTVVLESEPPGSQVYVDGAVAGTTPMTTSLSTGRHTVEFRRGESIRSLEIEVTAEKPTLARLDWTAARTGILRVDSSPTGATVVVDGRERGVTPLTLDDLTVGQHEVLLRSDAGSVRRTVTVSLEGPAEISEALYPGFMHVSAPIEVEVAQGGRVLTIDDQNQVLLPPGTHQVQFQNRSLGYLETRQVQIRPGETTRVLIAPSPSTLTVSATEAAEVLIDGVHAGYTPLTNFPIRLGTRDVVVRTSAGAERRFTLTVSATPAQLDVDFAAP